MNKKNSKIVNKIPGIAEANRVFLIYIWIFRWSFKTKDSDMWGIMATAIEIEINENIVSSDSA